MIVSTLNRTAALGGISRSRSPSESRDWVPPGTHEFSKFLAPDELATLAARAGLETREAAGMAYTPPLPGARAGATGGRGASPRTTWA